jgi:hypothetical protein
MRSGSPLTADFTKRDKLSCEHQGGVLVAVTELAPAAPGHFPGETPSLPGILRVRAQRPQARQSATACAHRDPGHVRPWNPKRGRENRMRGLMPDDRLMHAT